MSNLSDGTGGEKRAHAQAQRLQDAAKLPNRPQAGIRERGTVGDVQVTQPLAARLQRLKGNPKQTAAAREQGRQGQKRLRAFITRRFSVLMSTNVQLVATTALWTAPWQAFAACGHPTHEYMLYATALGLVCCLYLSTRWVFTAFCYHRYISILTLGAWPA